MADPVIAQKKPYVFEELAAGDYWWCSCGKSQKQPFCDGSHTSTKSGMKPVVFTQEKDQTVFFCGCKASTPKALMCTTWRTPLAAQAWAIFLGKATCTRSNAACEPCKIATRLTSGTSESIARRNSAWNACMSRSTVDVDASGNGAFSALENDLDVFCAVNKIDLPSADPERVLAEVDETIGLVDTSTAVRCSAKAGIGIEDILEGVIKNFKAPKDADADPLRALIFDSWFDPYQGVIALCRDA